MTEQTLPPSSRPVSPSASSKSPFRRERRKSGSRSIDIGERIELRTPQHSKQKTVQHTHSDDVFYGESVLHRTPLQISPGEVTSTNPRGPVLRHVRQHGHEEEEHAELSKNDSHVTLHDIRQSRWIQNPNNAAAEKIYLTTEAGPLSEMSTIATDFCWVHHRRHPGDMHFEDFVNTIDNIPGLYQHEHNAARKCLFEVKNMRRVFAKGKYLEPTVHQVTDNVEIIPGENTEVKATFVSMPVFSSMRCPEPHPDHDHHQHQYNVFRKPLQALFEKTHRLVHEEEYSRDHHRHLASRGLRARNGHPIRSLMQYMNILAIDNTRDWQQAVVRLEDEDDYDQPFIHVPEFWALIINMYTIVTCAPFSVEELQGDNIIHLPPPKEDMRVNVKYTNLSSALHEFRCRTWIGLLNTIASIEHQIDKEDELSVQLQREESLFKLVDVKFRLIDRRRWNALASNKSTSKVYIRLLKVAEGDPLNVTYSTRKFWTSRGLAWDLMRFQVESENLRKRLRDSRRQGDPLKKIRDIEKKLSQLRANTARARLGRIGQRFLYAAARYHLIDPSGLLFDDDQTYLEAVRTRRLVARAESTFPAALGGPSKQPGAKDSSHTDHNDHFVSEPSLNEVMPGNMGPGRKINGPQDAMNGKMMARTTAPDEKILERFRLPPPRIHDETPRLATSLKPDIGSSSALEGGPTARFPTPRKASTFTSPQYESVRDRQLRSPSRAYTMTGNAADLESQLAYPSSGSRVKFTGHIRTNHSTPALGVIEAERGSALATRDRSFASQSEDARLTSRHPTPYIFRPRAPMTRSTPTGPIAVAPLRLPPIVGETEFLPRHAIRSAISAQRSRVRVEGEVPSSSSQSDANVLAAVDSHGSSHLAKESQASFTTLGKRKDLKELQPFFEWSPSRVSTVNTPRDPQQSHGKLPPASMPTEMPNGSPSLAHDATSAAGAARDTLDILFQEMTSGYFISERFVVQPKDFADIKPKDWDDLISSLEEQKTSITLRKSNKKEEGRIRDLKVDIVLSIDTVLRCFIGKNNHDAPLIRYIWGMVERICELGVDDLRGINIHFTHCNHNVLAWLKRECSQIEQMCQEILVSARSDTGNRDEQLNLPLPRAFPSQFRDIVLFILSVYLLLGDPLKYQEAADEVSKTIDDGWTECESALLRDARELKEKGDDREYLQESIKTADTILGLLLQNAFSLSCSESSEKDKHLPHCDLEHIYRRWTTVCHERAVREASAEMYEEVRFLREELAVITTVLEDQKRVFEKTLQLRESPKQTLDIRINKRTETFLDDMIKHFTTLRNYAEEAETLTTNYIRVSNEDNSKAIFIFTFVTVIFLPLNSISSILGMNTSDIRNTKRNSTLFWEIAVPVMIAVLVICLVLVKVRFKFKLRRKVGRVLLMFFPKSWASDHMRIKKLGREVPRQS